MIGRIQGSVILKEDPTLIIDVAGMGYEVYVSTTTAKSIVLGQNIELWIQTIVREQSFELFGFSFIDERVLFRKLIDVPGVGPKTALGILGMASLETLVHAIRKNDSAYLTKASGIGKKTAEKIVLELRDKLDGFALASEDHSPDHDVLDALVALGFSFAEARNATQSIDQALSTHDKIRQALQALHH